MRVGRTFLQDPMPAEIQSMIDYAASKDVKLMGYVYPCLDFTGARML